MIPAPPPHPSLLRLGTRLAAGLSYSTVLADMDFETYSEAGYWWDESAGRWRQPPGSVGNDTGLGLVGAANYVAHPTFGPLCLKYDLKDGLGSRTWLPVHPTPPNDLFAYLTAGGLVEAWNVGFERWVWETYCVPVLGWPAVAASQWRCAMAKARAHSLPGALGKAGDVLRLSVRKDADGTRLLDKFSKPRNPTKGDPRLRIEPIWTDEDERLRAAAFVARGVELQSTSITPRKLETVMRNAATQAAEERADSEALLSYCHTDIVSEAEASARIPDLSPTELRYWQDDQAINRRGVRVDMETVEACIYVLEVAQQKYGRELAEITGGLKSSEVARLLSWLHGRGVHLDSLDEETIEPLLAARSLPPDVLRVLEIRALTASASVKKVYALRSRTTAAGRIHDLYQYHGARTGRPTGNGPQATNLPKAGPSVHRCGYTAQNVPLPGGGCGRFHGAHTLMCHWCGRVTMRGPKDVREWEPAAAEDAIAAVRFRSLEFLELLFGDALLTLAGVLRGLFIAAEGHDLISSDYTAIEGVVIACIAGERWRVDAYAADSPMYLLSAERMFGVSVEEMKAYAKANGRHHPLRQKGKGGELGLGFGGWINALRQFDVDGPDDELVETVLKWRAASPAIVWFWGGQTRGVANEIRGNAGMPTTAKLDRWDKTPEYFGLEGAAVQAVLNPGVEQHVARLDGTPTGVSYIMQHDVLYCRVPSGGLITYHYPRLERSEKEWRGLSLSFMGWNTNPKAGPMGWVRMNTYGGKQAENVVQKTARDIQMAGIARLEDADYPIVMHTYDEVVAEVPEGFGGIEELECLMTTLEPWAAGWPIKAAGGWRGKRYRKA